MPNKKLSIYNFIEEDDLSDIKKYISPEKIDNAYTNELYSFDIAYNYFDKLKNYNKARYWFKIAYSLGLKKNSSYNIASLYFEEKNYKKAIPWYKRTIKHGNNTAFEQLAIIYEESEEYKEAIYWYEKAFTSIDSNFAVNISLIYQNKLSDFKNAEKWLKKGISKGSHLSVSALSTLYFDFNKTNLAAALCINLLAYENTPYKKKTFFMF